MPRRNVRADATVTGADDWKSRSHFIRLSIEEELECQDWYTSRDHVWHVCLEELLDNGYAVKIAPPMASDLWYCTVQNKSGVKDLIGHSFVAQYADFETVVILAYWVITVLLEDGRLDISTTTQSRTWLK